GSVSAVRPRTMSASALICDWTSALGEDFAAGNPLIAITTAPLPADRTRLVSVSSSTVQISGSYSSWKPSVRLVHVCPMASGPAFEGPCGWGKLAATGVGATVGAIVGGAVGATVVDGTGNVTAGVVATDGAGVGLAEGM